MDVPDMKKYFNLLFLLFVFFACILSSGQSADVMKNIIKSTFSHEKDQLVIVIDPGHGGFDPGKVGINNALEKDINLMIAFRLKTLLEENDIQVIMTRQDDSGLYSQGASNKKREDMIARVSMIKEHKADLAISIHQNSYTEEYVKGAQVFYHTKSLQGKQLAEILQEQIVKTIGDGNHRKAKANDNYYMLKNTECPLVIVECGYLSNIREAGLLLEESYQERMAYAIHLGILRYLHKEKLVAPQNKL